MSDTFLSELDDIVSDALDDTQNTSTDIDVESTVTVGHAVSTEQQTSIIDDKIEWLSERLDVPPSTVELAKSLRDQYREKRGDLQGTALELVAASCVYCAVKVTDVPLDPTDFAKTDDEVVTRKSLLRRSKDIANTVGLDPTAFMGSEEYVKRYCKELDLPESVEARALEIVEVTEKSGLSSGKSPSGWAGAAVYNACLDLDQKRTQSEISSAANVSEVTIRNRYQEQREALRKNESLPSDPADAIQEIASKTDILEKTTELAKLLLEHASDPDTELDLDDNPTLWALAALRRGGELTDSQVSLKSLSQYTKADTSEISSRARRLRSVIRQRELQAFRAEQTEEPVETE